MDIEEIRMYALGKENVEESFPFGEDTLVFKVHGKIFLLMGLDRFPASINLKCDPDWAIMLREEHEEIKPGFHMNKKHWNTVEIASRLSVKLIKEMIDHSFDLVKPKTKAKK